MFFEVDSIAFKGVVEKIALEGLSVATAGKRVPSRAVTELKKKDR